MKTHYPASFGDISAWAAERKMRISEARERFVQGAILRAIATSRELSRILVFKGGNALDFLWSPNRSTKDLDFSSLDNGLEEQRLQKLLEQSLQVVGRSLGLGFRIHAVIRNPPGPGKTFVTFEVRVGYALPDDRNNTELLAAGKPSKALIPLEVSLNEPVCDETSLPWPGAPNPLRVSTREEIIAEKLRALLQQLIRNRTRRQDLLDIAVLLRRTDDVDRPRIAEYLLRKAEARGVPVSKAAFHSKELADRARQDYAALQQTTRELFIPFDEALREVLAFVDTMSIPD